VVAALSFGAVSAQGKEDPKKEFKKKWQKRKGFGKMGGKDLNLTEEQKKQFKSANADWKKQMSELRKNENITVKEQKEKVAALRNEHQVKVKSILTDEQKASIQKNNEQRKTRLKEMGEKRKQNMNAELGINKKQADKLDASR